MTGEDVGKSVSKQAQLEFDAERARDAELLKQNPSEDPRLGILLWYVAAVLAITGACFGSHGGAAVAIDAIVGLVYGAIFLFVGFALSPLVVLPIVALVPERIGVALWNWLRPFGGGRLVFALVVTLIAGSVSFVGLSERRLVSAHTHFDECRKPKTRVDLVYPPSNQCADGWVSPSEGAGRCSYHGGVNRRPTRVETLYRDQTDTQCEKQAKDLSWLE